MANPFDQFDNTGSVAPIIPRTPAPQTPAQAAKDAADAENARNNASISAYKVHQEKLATDKEDQQKAADAEQADNLLAEVRRARSLVSGWSTGMGGAALEHLPGSQAAQLETIVNQGIRGNVFLNRIAQLKDSNPSPNGGTGIGRIMQAEIPLITGAIGPLDPVNMGKDQTLKSLDEIEARTLRMKAIMNGENPDDPAVQKKYQIPQLPTYQPSPGGDGGAPPPSQLTPEQQSKERAFLATKPSAEQYAAFLSGMLNANVPVENAAARLKAVEGGAGYNPGVVNTTEQQAVQDRIAKDDKLGIDQTSDAQRLLMHGATLGLSDEASGVGEALANAITSPFTSEKFDPVGSYRLGRDVERQRLSDAENRLGYVGTGIEFGGSLASGNPASAVSKVYNLGSLVRQGAKAGGAYGAIAGYGQGQGTQDSLVGAGVGGLTGAGIGAIGGRFLGGKPPTDIGGGPAPGEIADALQTEGIAAARPIADPSVRGKMAYLETTRGGNNVVRQSLERTRQDIADKVAGLTPSGEAMTPGGAGEMVQEAGKRSIQSMKDTASRLYDRAASAAGDAVVQPTEALARLDANIADLERNPNTNKGVLSYLRSVRGDLASGNRTVADIRNIRTNLSGEINRRNLGQSNAERIMGDVMDAARSDIERDLGRTNPDALSLYQQGDDAWRQMATERSQVLEKIIGPADNPISGEQAMSRLRNMMGNKGDLNRFQRTFNMMNPEEQANFRASLFNGIGQRSPEEPFSPAYFVQQTRDLQPGALKTIFGEDGAKSIQNLRVASKGFTDAQASLNNSRSGFVANFKDIVSSIINLKSAGGGAAGFAVGGLPGAIAGAATGEMVKLGANRVSAKLLMNPEVSSWIRKVAVAKTDTQARALVGKLDAIAAGNAGLQSEIGGLREAITRALNDNAPNAGSLAASPDQRPDQEQ